MRWKYSLDFLRATAILLVLFYHLPVPTGHFWSSVYAHIHHGFNSGVEMFFVLSGFLISEHWFEQIKRKDNVKSMMRDFYIKRTFRILPLYYLVLAFEALRASFLTNRPYNLLSYLTLTQNLFTKSIFPVSWSLCVEEHFYLFFPLTSLLFFSMKKARLFVGFCLSLLIFTIALRFSNLGFILSHPEAELVQNTLFTLDGLLIGVLVAYLFTFYSEWMSSLVKNIRAIELTGVLVVAYALYLAGTDYSSVKIVFLPTIFSIGYGLLVLTAQYEKSILNSFQNSFITLTSKISYPLYLTHYTAWMMVQLLLTKLKIELPGFIFLVIHLAAAYGLAYLLHQTVEKRFLALRKRFLSET